ncbi:hypothetical protein SAMN04487850_2321 [Prevotella aff. ruminicola Tc2-24]|uniref:Uncharacterized protein n=1 Tax=Prevotella aff. ruminicola Tc2-24 TaxID=81582 RepID=A0A1I0QC06_9BACT|nr:hypothetical protein SAMN04487850_2321 [Prevotella aff. ruminicola Tc2-24]
MLANVTYYAYLRKRKVNYKYDSWIKLTRETFA